MGDLAGKGHVMTAIEVLERAISKLETLRDAVASPYWIRDRADIIAVEVDEGEYVASYLVASDLAANDAALIVALSRTVEPMLALLRKGRASMRGTETLGKAHPHTPLQKHALALARAILGEENDHDR